MTDSRVALGMDRLPWLPDEPARTRKSSGGNMLGWAAFAILLVAGVAYWLGQRSAQDSAPAPESSLTRPEATIRLPDAAAPVGPTAVQPVTAPKAEPIAAPPIPIMESRPATRRAPIARVRDVPEAIVEDDPGAAEAESALNQTIAAQEAPKPVTKDPWPVRAVEGASGRLVRVGAFRTARQAKKGWAAIVKSNPALKRLPALVVPVQSQRNGQVYYRLQMGTTSQAHSAVLCQRMRMIAQSCVVIDDRTVGL
jgi:hypothetical protein